MLEGGDKEEGVEREGEVVRYSGWVGVGGV